MAINRDAPLNGLGPWNLGINNVASDYELPQGALRDAVNVDITITGHAHRRKGRVSVYSAAAAHSLFSDGAVLYGVSGQNLSYFTRALSGTLTPTTIRSGFPAGSPVAFLNYPSLLDRNRIYYSNGAVTGMLVNKVSFPWGVKQPSGQPQLTAATAGGMDAGTYQVAVTFISSFGEESGTGESARVAVAAGGGITLSAIPQPAAGDSVAQVRVYCSEANGSIPYLRTILAVGVTSAVLARTVSPGRRLETQFMRPPPAGSVVELHYGRIYIGAGPVLYWTEALRPGGHMLTNSLVFPGNITLLASTNAGLIVAADKTYFMAGSNPRTAIRTDRFPYGAINGSLVRDARHEVMYWLANKGLMAATYAGEIRNLTEGFLVVRKGTLASTVLRETNGVRQIISSIVGGLPDPLTHDEFLQAVKGG